MFCWPGWSASGDKHDPQRGLLSGHQGHSLPLASHRQASATRGLRQPAVLPHVAHGGPLPVTRSPSCPADPGSPVGGSPHAPVRRRRAPGGTGGHGLALGERTSGRAAGGTGGTDAVGGSWHLLLRDVAMPGLSSLTIKRYSATKKYSFFWISARSSSTRMLRRRSCSSSRRKASRMTS